MPDYHVQSEVVNIRTYLPKKSDIFLVDTNVWYWTCYASAQYAVRKPKHYQLNDYPDFLKRVLTVSGKLHWMGLSISELAHLIEQTEFELAGNLGATTGSIKDWRHGKSDERARVAREISETWAEITGMATELSPFLINQDAVNQCIEKFSALRLDAYDIFMVQAMDQRSLNFIITDDGDYCSVPGLRVFTANRWVIEAAESQGKLIK